MAVRRRDEGGIIAAMRIDLQRLHETWMELIFPRQRDADQTVLGKWRPKSTGGWVAYRFWGAVGTPIIAVLYLFALVGFATRYYTRRIDSTAASLGIMGVIVLSVLVWGGLTLFAYVRDFSESGVIAVAAASGVATISAVFALVFRRIGGRFTTVFLSYPFAMTAIFLPPVVAALYSPALAYYIFPKSTSLAIWLLDHPLAALDLSEFLRARYDLRGVAYVGMWFGIAVPVGWVLGIFVTLANVVRPKG